MAAEIRVKMMVWARGAKKGTAVGGGPTTVLNDGSKTNRFNETAGEAVSTERGGLSRTSIWGCDRGDPMPGIRQFHGESGLCDIGQRQWNPGYSDSEFSGPDSSEPDSSGQVVFS